MKMGQYRYYCSTVPRVEWSTLVNVGRGDLVGVEGVFIDECNCRKQKYPVKVQGHGSDQYLKRITNGT